MRYYSMNKIMPVRMFPAMPTQVRVLGKIFKIRSLPEEEHADADGIMQLDAQDIGIRQKTALAYMQDTLLHEITHAIDETLVLKMTERQVSNMASVLLGVLKDNPELTKWLLENE